MEFRVAIIHTPQCKAGLYLPSNIKVPLRQIWQTNISAPPKTLNLKNAYFVVILHSISILIKSILSLILREELTKKSAAKIPTLARYLFGRLCGIFIYVQ